MPMLPSGRHVGLSPDPLVKLLENPTHFGNVHKIMALKNWIDLFPWIDVLFFVPEARLEDMDMGELSDDSLPAPPGLVAVRSGFRLSNWEAHATDWSEADHAAMRELIDGRAREHFGQHLDHARVLQEQLRSLDASLVTQVLAGWHDAGIHPAQEEGWEENDEARGDRKHPDAH